MKISIVTISYNQAAFLERALCSVLDQKAKAAGAFEVEYIVVDAGSDDGSREIIERYRPHLDHVVLEPDHGPADGLNKGFACASGDVLGYINADDAYLPGAFAAIAGAFGEAGGAAGDMADVLIGHGYIVDGGGRMIRRFRSTGFDLADYAAGAAVVMQQATFFRRTAFEKAGGFNIENRTCWDSELLLAMALAGCRFARIDRMLALFTLHGESISGSQRHQDQYRKDRARLMTRAAAGRLPSPPLRLWRRARARLADPAGLWWLLRDTCLPLKEARFS